MGVKSFEDFASFMNGGNTDNASSSTNPSQTTEPSQTTSTLDNPAVDKSAIDKAAWTAASNNSRITGSCLCGDVRYSLTGCPFNRVLCHCENCRKMTGSMFMANSFFKMSQLDITQGKDQINQFVDEKTRSGYGLERSFCQRCGSPLFLSSKENPRLHDVVIVATGSMDIDHQSFEDEWRPDQEFFCSSRRAWIPEVPDTVKKN